MNPLWTPKNFYALHDSEPRGVFAVEEKDLFMWNKSGHGIFWSINPVEGLWKNENVTSVRFWGLDFDAKNGTKAAQLRRIEESPVIPASVIETKSGHHVYIKAKDASLENYDLIMTRLIRFFNADNVKGLCRILRVPNYWHLKNPSEPFLIKEIFESNCQYTERQIDKIFPEEEQEEKKQSNDPEFWHRINDVCCEEGLLKLSGTRHVQGDVFELRPEGRRKRIYVNQEKTSCWVDESGLIGSLDGGGPTLWNWLNWYYKDKRLTTKIMKEVFLNA